MREAKTEKPHFLINVNLDKSKTMVRIDIEDNGPGMDEETKKRVFEPFFTTKDPGIGTGLGLSVSYFIITENHGGKMYVKTAIGKGSNFSILLPIES